MQAYNPLFFALKVELEELKQTPMRLRLNMMRSKQAHEAKESKQQNIELQSIYDIYRKKVK